MRCACFGTVNIFSYYNYNKIYIYLYLITIFIIINTSFQFYLIVIVVTCYRLTEIYSEPSEQTLQIQCVENIEQIRRHHDTVNTTSHHVIYSSLVLNFSKIILNKGI